MRITALNVHPVKSTAIRPVEQAEVTRAGLTGDREWMVVNDFGELVSARELKPLYSITADTAATGLRGGSDLRLSAPGVEPLLLDRPLEGQPATVTMFNYPPMPARSAGQEADDWLDRALGTSGLHLVWCSEPARRALDLDHSRDGDHARFQDGSPVTLLSTASVRQLGDWLAQEALEHGEQPPTFGAERFRPNILIDGVDTAFAEDTWSRVRVGTVDFRVAERVSRCVMTTVDPETFEGGKEPVRTLARYRRDEGRTWMAIHLIPDSEGTISVGDEIVAD